MTAGQADIKAIRNALRDTLIAGCAGTIAKGFNWYARPIAAPKLPYGMVMPAATRFVKYHETWAKSGVSVVNLRIDLHSSARTEDAMVLLDELVSFTPTAPVSIVNMIAANRTLGGIVTAVNPTEAIGPQPGVSEAVAALLLQIQP